MSPDDILLPVNYDCWQIILDYAAFKPTKLALLMQPLIDGYNKRHCFKWFQGSYANNESFTRYLNRFHSIEGTFKYRCNDKCQTAQLCKTEASYRCRKCHYPVFRIHDDWNRHCYDCYYDKSYIH